MLKQAGLVLGVLLLFCCVGVSQVQRFDFNLGYTGNFSKTSSGNFITLSPTNSGGFLFSFIFHLNSHSGLQFNYNKTRNSQFYEVDPDTFRVITNISEFSGAYVLNFMHHEKWDPFVFAGAGILNFSPKSTFVDESPVVLGASGQKPVAWIYGGGVDYKLSERFYARLQYRGVFYKAPDFELQRLFTGATGHMAEPSIGIAFKF